MHWSHISLPSNRGVLQRFFPRDWFNFESEASNTRKQQFFLFNESRKSKLSEALDVAELFLSSTVDNTEAITEKWKVAMAERETDNI